ncbi:SCP2 sterol-binding domain-containing protein [Actinophytocola sp.]|uniref:SCP2 sterol-binding domain-containing protein n=1 Tax=Actinophytocola sp. TaxID=1872138 RepID=UPI002ED69212
MRFRRRRVVPAPADSPVDIDTFARAIDPKLLDEGQFVQLIDVLDMLGRVGTGVRLAAMSTDTFVWFVSRATPAQLDHLMSHPHLRHVVFDEIFRRMGEHLDTAKAATLQAVVHWRFTGGSDGYDRFETIIENGTCRSGTEPTADPRVTITLAPADFLRVVTGGVHVAMLFMRGKVKVRGDIAFAANLISYFDLPSEGDRHRGVGQHGADVRQEL